MIIESRRPGHIPANAAAINSPVNPPKDVSDMQPEPHLTCIIKGCENSAVDRSNQYRTVPLTCDDCHRKDIEAMHKSRKCDYCGHRRQCSRDIEGNLQCKKCFQDKNAREVHEHRMAHSHSVNYVRMTFTKDGAPDDIRAVTHCQWQEPANLENGGRPGHLRPESRPAHAALLRTPSWRRAKDAAGTAAGRWSWQTGREPTKKSNPQHREIRRQQAQRPKEAR